MKFMFAFPSILMASIFAVSFSASQSFASQSATSATVVGCKGTMANGKTIEVLLDYTSNEVLGATSAEIEIDGVKLQTSFKDLEGAYVNVGTPNAPFMNWTESKIEGLNSISLRYPEQDPDAASTAAFLTLLMPGESLDIQSLEVACQ